MANYTVKKYEQNDAAIWNDFIAKAKNATFLFHRDFTEYHKDRFTDFSLLVFKNEKLMAVLPANKEGNFVCSHQGLTYGGLVYKDQMKLSTVMEVFHSVLLFLNENGIKKMILKTLPSIYHLKPAEEITYCLFVAEAKLIRRDALSVIDLSQKNAISKIRKRGFQKAVSHQLKIKEEDNFESFWNEILIPNLEKRHKAIPVHSLEEISRLKNFFFPITFVSLTFILRIKLLVEQRFLKRKQLCTVSIFQSWNRTII